MNGLSYENVSTAFFHFVTNDTFDRQLSRGMQRGKNEIKSLFIPQYVNRMVFR